MTSKKLSQTEINEYISNIESDYDETDDECVIVEDECVCHGNTDDTIEVMDVDNAGTSSSNSNQFVWEISDSFVPECFSFDESKSGVLVTDLSPNSLHVHVRFALCVHPCFKTFHSLKNF